MLQTRGVVARPWGIEVGMQRVLSTYLFVKRKLVPALLSDVARAGIPAIELFCARNHFDHHSSQEVRELAAWLSGHDLKLHSVHAPTERDSSAMRESAAPLSISDTERVRRLDAVDEIKRALDIAELIPFRFLVQHVCASRERMDPRKWDAAFSSLEHLMLFAGQRGVTIALENTPGDMATPVNLRQFIQDTRLNLRLCFDTGHAHIEDGVETSFETMRELVVTTHVHDNHGEKDEHLLPYEGTINWNAAARVLARGADGGLPIVLELKDQTDSGTPCEHKSVSEMLSAARDVFEKLEKSLGEQG